MSSFKSHSLWVTMCICGEIQRDATKIKIYINFLNLRLAQFDTMIDIQILKFLQSTKRPIKPWNWKYFMLLKQILPVVRCTLHTCWVLCFRLFESITVNKSSSISTVMGYQISQTIEKSQKSKSSKSPPRILNAWTFM